MRHILFPSDFGKSSQAALPVALTLAQTFQIELRAFHGIPANGDEHDFDNFETVQLLAEQNGLPFASTYNKGDDITAMILHQASIDPPVATVMGTHGRGPIAKWVMGSITETILKQITTPLVLVTEHAMDREWKGIKTILVGIDFSLQSRFALGWASVIAKRTDAVIHVMHTIETGQMSGTPFEFPSLSNLDQNSEETVRQAFRNFDSNIQFAALPHHHVCSGVAAKEIVRLANEISADLLIIGPHGNGGVKELLIGSTTDRVVRTANCPVMIAKSQPALADPLSE
ncbi:MAG: universal stress protein [bacterium]|nr:universal stress protein [bacterium]